MQQSNLALVVLLQAKAGLLLVQAAKTCSEGLKRQQRESREQKHGDPDYEEPASEDYAKKKARDAEKRGGKEERRRGHDAKQRGEGDRSKRQLKEDYDEPR